MAGGHGGHSTLGEVTLAGDGSEHITFFERGHLHPAGGLVEVDDSVRGRGAVRALDGAVLKAWGVDDVGLQVGPEVMGLEVDAAFHELKITKFEPVIHAVNRVHALAVLLTKVGVAVLPGAVTHSAACLLGTWDAGGTYGTMVSAGGASVNAG
jgi:hypothetical protein